MDSTSLIVLLIIIGMIIWGLLSLFAQDLMWLLTERQHRAQGISSERTPQWERNLKITGVLLIIGGVILAIMYFAVT